MIRFVLAFVFTVASTVGVSSQANDRPNIVVIVCDDLGFSDLGCYGGEIETPNLDRLASNGLRFTDFHNNAKCSETRASLLTGLWHQQSKNLKLPGNVTLAEVLRDSGYSTLMSGKWHLAGHPLDRGFDRYFGFLSGAANFFTGQDWESGQNLMRLDREVFEVPGDFYTTDAFTDYAIKFIDQARTKDRPYFLYLAHNAPHFPLHALPDDIAKYRGRYDVGWDEIRERRFRRQQKLGIVDQTWSLSERDPKLEPFSTLTQSQKEFLTPMMEVYAAMVDRLDQNVGRLVSDLQEHGDLDNTVILFFSDNGACPYNRMKTPNIGPGPAESNYAYDARWANMCNTPMRLYKQYAHEGGSLTPLIAHWPAAIKQPGGLTNSTHHIVDLMPTVIELANGQYPGERDGQPINPSEGISLVPSIRGQAIESRPPIFWEFASNHAIREGNWKLVAERSRDWELYDLSLDRTETNDVSDRYPDVVRRLSQSYNAWAKRVNAKTHPAAKKTKPSKQSQLFDLSKH
ncbi:arylsulfatase [Roseiconus lacunae]|uniref:arylsulfatase n=1 Tax=Roseiconus lacunae TaxID=2605694 RepID=UPI001E5D20D3|nr:arylsulfatase [Roseiconus lacunae]MCD0463623.1 arylsulfatase [Roseiconus lacunae]